MNATYKYMVTNQYSLITGFGLLFAASVLLMFSVGLARADQPLIASQKADVTVYKTEFCGCCSKWTDHLEKNGLKVEVRVVKDTSPVRARLGVPREMASCHTAVVGDYWVEGHVPADLISQLMQEKPANIKGISAPGMPPGSPGMEIPNPSSYKVYSMNNTGEIELYATRKGASVPHSD